MNKIRLGEATPDLAVFASAASAFLWSVLLGLPGEVTGSRVLTYFSVMGGDTAWSLIFCSVCVAQIYSLYWSAHNKFETKRSQLLNLTLSFTASSLWTFVTFLLCIGEYPISPTIGSTAVIAAGMWWDFLSCELDLGLWKYNLRVNSSRSDITKRAA